MAIIRADFFSHTLMRTVTVNAILPVDKYAFPGMPVREKKPFKTLYLLHGIFGNYTDWVAGTRIEKWAMDANLAVIMPSGENKFYVDNPATMDNFSQFIGEELIEMTRTLFPLSDKREDTYIAGLSMGGYGAITNGLKWHEKFSHIGMLSAGLILENVENSTEDEPMQFRRRSYYEAIFGPVEKIKGSDKDYYALAEKLEKSERPSIYMCCGTEDTLIKDNDKFYAYLKELGYDVTYETGPGGHDWVFWDTYIRKILAWLPLEDKTEAISSGNVRLEKK